MSIFLSERVRLQDVVESLVPVRTLGRVHTVRSHGRLTFVDLWHNGARRQVVVRGACDVAVGQWVEVEGVVHPTQRGELSLWAERWVVHSQATEAFETQPEHGRVPPEQRFVLNPSLVDTARVRALTTRTLRQCLWAEGFEEVSTPVLGRFASGAAARPFATWARAHEREMFLRVAPEAQLIRLLMAGFDSVFELGPCFRNEGVSERHQPQFELLECYRVGEQMEQTMERLEHLLRQTLLASGSLVRMWGEHMLDWSGVRRATLEELVEEHTGCLSATDCVEWARERGLWHEGNDPLLAWCVVFEHAVEARLVQPTFVTRWPVCVSPLARHTDNGWSARFELYASGMELANGYEQEMDREEQRRRFAQQANLHGQEDVMSADEEYLFAMGWGMPPLSGFGLGIDRWVQMLTNSADIRTVVLLPL